MNTQEISIHQIKVFLCLKQHNKQWLTVADVAKETAVARRTSSEHLLRFVKLGVVDQAEVFPGHRFRLSRTARSTQQRHYLRRLNVAVGVFGLKP